mmetsp:Transcript_9496/g.21787  ORF Transcript_9496/g.21787 Transcript_9496/m.21787 type:complete len:470 (+) Transcript_9496:117-1526(+)
MNRIWVGGLPQGVKEEELEEAFSKCGSIVKIQIRHSNIDTFAFVSFADRKAYDRALRDMDQSKFFGQPMKVNVVIQKGEEGNSGRGAASSGPRRDRDDRDNRGDRDDRDKSNRYDRDKSRDRDDRSRRREDSRKPSRRRDDDRRGGRSRSTRRDADRDRYSEPRRDRDRYRDDRDGRDRDRDRDRSPGDRYGDRDRDRERNGSRRDESREAGRRYDRRGGRSEDRRAPSGGRGGRTRSPSPRRDRSRARQGSRRRDSPDSDRPARTYSRQDDDSGGSRIWVGGMPSTITESEIDRVFKRYGPVEEIVVRHSDFDTFGFVQFRNTSNAAAAIKDLDQAQRFGVTIKVAYAGNKTKTKGKGDGKGDGRKGGGKGRDRSRSRDQGGRSGVRHCVKLENLPNDMEREELFELAKEYGNVLHHDVWQESKTRTNGGVIEYGKKDEAMEAYEQLNDRSMDGWDKRILAQYEQRDG